jgi:hypothetical protein
MKEKEMLTVFTKHGFEGNAFFDVKKPSKEMKVMLGVEEDDSTKKQDNNPGFFKTGKQPSREMLIMLGVKQ